VSIVERHVVPKIHCRARLPVLPATLRHAVMPQRGEVQNLPGVDVDEKRRRVPVAREVVDVDGGPRDASRGPLQTQRESVSRGVLLRELKGVRWS